MTPTLRKGEQLHRFDDGDETVVVSTIQHPNGEYSASEHNATGRRPIGWGFSTIGAIADLFEKMPRAASEREERDLAADRQAWAFDHKRDLEKHGV